jgi:RNA polymerase sigma-70 factor (ECF subfamily)
LQLLAQEVRMSTPTHEADDFHEVLERVRSGDAQALDALLSRHRPYLLRLVASRLDPKLRPRLDPSDVVQEAQLEAIRRLPHYLSDPAMPFRVWLRQLACDRLIMARRRHLGAARRTVDRELPLTGPSSGAVARQLAASITSPSRRIDDEEQARRVQSAVALLTEADREILTMRVFEGLSFEEIACVLGIEAAAARKRHGRALLRLHKLLAQQD